MNTNTPCTSAVTDEEYHLALTRYARAQSEVEGLRAYLREVEEKETAAYKHLKQLRATIARETLEKINGR